MSTTPKVFAETFACVTRSRSAVAGSGATSDVSMSTASSEKEIFFFSSFGAFFFENDDLRAEPALERRLNELPSGSLAPSASPRDTSSARNASDGSRSAAELRRCSLRDQSPLSGSPPLSWLSGSPPLS